jgi:hypothetical protein
MLAAALGLRPANDTGSAIAKPDRADSISRNQQMSRRARRGLSRVPKHRRTPEAPAAQTQPTQASFTPESRKLAAGDTLLI